MENVRVNTVVKPPTGRKMKARAPPPPQAPQPAPRRNFPAAQPTAAESSEQSSGDLKENVLRLTVDILIILPDGMETKRTVNGSKALMDLLVDLCSQYHLSPAYHTLELQSSEAQPLAFKPNTLLGKLDVHTVLIKEKVVEEKPRRPPPKVPEKSVRLIVNYHRAQKAVVRVNPLVPLKNLIPLICEKCEFDHRHVILLRDNINNRELELSKSLNDLGIRELYLLDHSMVLLSKKHSAPVLNYGESGQTSSLSTCASEKKGFLGFFNTRKSKPEEERAMDTYACDYGGYSTVPSTPAVNARPGTLGPSLSVGNIPRMCPKEDLKKRRAPPPPAGLSSLHSSQEATQVTPGSPNANQQKKRRAPPPPRTPVLSTKMEEKAPVSSNKMEEAESEISNKMEEAEPVMNNTAEETELMSNYKVEETENHRHSTMGAWRQVPVKPRRGNVRDPPQLVLPPPPPYHPCLDTDFMDPQVFQPTDVELASQMDLAHQSWLRSVQDSHLEQKNEMESQGLQELETVSMASSGSFPDNTCAASESTTEDSGIVSSPSDIAHPPSPDSSLRMGRQLSLDQCSSEADVPCHTDVCSAASQDFSSDSEEGSTAWTSRSRQNSGMCLGESRRGIDLDQYDEDLYITTQLHQTLADLEAGLAEIEDIDCAMEMSTFSKEKIEMSYLGKEPVSELEMTIPVTAIDEVCEEYRCSMTDYEVNKTKTEEETNTEKYFKSDLENKNNNAGTSDKEPTISINLFDALISTDQLSPTTNTDCVTPRKGPLVKLKDQTQRKIDNHEDKIVLGSFKKTQMISTQQKILSKESGDAETQSKNQVKATEYSGSNKHHEGQSSAKWKTAQSKIPHDFVSRIGMNTFTVVPPKPAVKLYQKEGGSLVSGAIKIDAQGNLIKPDVADIIKRSSSGAGNDEEDSLLGKAKAFWNSAEQTELDTTNRVAITKHSVDPEASIPQRLQPGSKLPPEEAKSVKPKELKEDLVRDCTEGDQKKPVIPGLTYQPPKSYIPTTPSSNIGPKADPTFLKPFRRTSSQYLASAIAKYTGMPTPRAEPLHDSAQKNHESIQENEIQMYKSTNFNQQSAIQEDFQGTSQYKHRESNSIKHVRASSAISKAKEPGLTVSSVNQSRPLSFPNQYFTLSQSTRPAFKESVSTEEKTKSDMPNPIQSEAHTITVQENRKMKSFEFHPSPKSPTSVSPRSFVAPLKPDSSSNRSYRYPSTSQTGSRAPHGNTESLSQKTEMWLSEAPSTNEAEPSLQANAGIFGPVKTFKPVTLKPVQKDTSLHSLLMESIQGSEGKEKLRKTSDTTRNYTQKKPSFVEEENERSALLSAIRSQNHTTRLRKTTSAASEELCAIKNIPVTENHRNTEAFLFRPAFSPPPPPPSPPPPPVLTKVYHSNSSTNSHSNPEQTRETLLEAIRTGPGAAQLKRVPAPSKTVLVNARLGSES
ncbi:protein cordon-bleu-like isoform X3 [Acipenser ruthenus]|uniref:protein cordon-bleu-like isoform X3 n=1 Tax=Acipenser ruthenus TaxID=7906 RepID=UPI0027417310|nr:protein cordon-bleu-like isoform X3 [Acipenser ruthenus]